MNLILNLSKSGIGEKELVAYKEKIFDAERKLKEGQEGFNGWLELPGHFSSKELKKIKAAAEEIGRKCRVLVVIGIGGSYLGAKACIEMMKYQVYQKQKDGERHFPIVIFAGNNISAVYHHELINSIRDKDICLCVVSKSGTTAETNIAFSILKKLMYEKYGKKEACGRIYAVTDERRGELRQEAEAEGYKSFVIPDNIGGRYSVLTPVGLLPIAAAGISVDEIMRGAADGREEYDGYDMYENICNRYTASRDILEKRGKKIEIFEAYEPRLRYFGEWLKQLFGESEGKQGKGIFPTQLQFTTDLHSMGQFIQEGSPIFFETVMNILKSEQDITIPETAAAQYRGKTMNQVNYAAYRGVVMAHAEGRIPVISLDIPEISPYFFGKMVYFFERSCALRGYLMGINPFDQPGVEKYKAYMKEALND